MARHLDESAIHERLENLKAQVQDLEGQIEGKIQEHPLGSVAAAFGAGVVAGLALQSLLKKR